MHNEAMQGHYLLHISFSSGIFSKVCAAGGHYHYTIIRQAKERLPSGLARPHALPVKEVKSGGKRTSILGSETAFRCCAVH